MLCSSVCISLSLSCRGGGARGRRAALPRVSYMVSYMHTKCVPPRSLCVYRRYRSVYTRDYICASCVQRWAGGVHYARGWGAGMGHTGRSAAARERRGVMHRRWSTSVPVCRVSSCVHGCACCFAFSVSRAWSRVHTVRACRVGGGAYRDRPDDHPMPDCDGCTTAVGEIYFRHGDISCP